MVNFFSQFLGYIYLKCVIKHHRYCSRHWIDFMAFCVFLAPILKWLSKVFINLGYHYFNFFLKPLAAHGHNLVEKRWQA
jgi:hypothetical protein